MAAESNADHSAMLQLCELLHAVDASLVADCWRTAVAASEGSDNDAIAAVTVAQLCDLLPAEIDHCFERDASGRTRPAAVVAALRAGDVGTAFRAERALESAAASHSLAQRLAQEDEDADGAAASRRLAERLAQEDADAARAAALRAADAVTRAIRLAPPPATAEDSTTAASPWTPRPLSSKALALAEKIGCKCGAGLASTAHSRSCMDGWYAQAREEADQLRQRKRDLLAQAAEVYRRASGSAAAGVYAERARDLEGPIAAANELASHALLILQNPRTVALNSGGASGGAGSSWSSSGAPESTVDLHGQHADEAVDLLIHTVLPGAAADGVRELHILTGKGTHSHKGRPTMKAAVGKCLRDSVGAVVGEGGRTPVAISAVTVLPDGWRVTLTRGE